MVFDCDYPYKPPKILALSDNFIHPNLDFRSKEMILTILDKYEWSPVIGINTIFCQLEKILIKYDINCVSLQSLELFESLEMYNTIDYVNKFCSKVNLYSQNTDYQRRVLGDIDINDLEDSKSFEPGSKIEQRISKKLKTFRPNNYVNQKEYVFQLI